MPRKCLFLGYADRVKGYCLWDPTAHKVIISRDMVFVEDKQLIEEGDDSTGKRKIETTEVLVEDELGKNDSSKAGMDHEKHESDILEKPELRRTVRVRN